jgi:hypothetical protein
MLIAAWERTQGNHAEYYPALDGQGMDVVYRRQSRLNIVEGSDLIEFAKYMATELEVVLHEPKKEEEHA